MLYLLIMVKIFIENINNVIEQYAIRNNENSFLEAFLNKDKEMMVNLLELYSKGEIYFDINLINKLESSQKTLLGMAIDRNYTEIVKLLVINGADITCVANCQARDQNPVTALGLAIEKSTNEDTEIIQFLLQNGASILSGSTIFSHEYEETEFVISEYKLTPLMIAVYKGSLECVNIILRDCQNRLENIETIMAYLDETSELGNALIMAIISGHQDIVQALISMPYYPLDTEHRTKIFINGGFAVERSEYINLTALMAASVNGVTPIMLPIIHAALAYKVYSALIAFSSLDYKFSDCDILPNIGKYIMSDKQHIQCPYSDIQERATLRRINFLVRERQENSEKALMMNEDFDVENATNAPSI